MTDKEIFETEIKCINRRASGKCNGGTDCCKCDLLMNENDIIYAYERAIANNDLINRQQEEIERLKTAFANSQKTSKYWHKKCGELVEEVQAAKAEAYKEFAEHLKEKWSNNDYYSPDVDFDEFIDNLLKEMIY